MRLIITLILSGCILLVTSCNNTTEEQVASGEYAQRIAKLEAENKALKEESEQRKATITDFVEAFNDINENLETIKQKENIISLSAASMELKPADEEKIQEDILFIYELLQENKQTVEALRLSIRESNIKNKELLESVDNLSRTVHSKNMEMDSLREKLSKRNSKLHKMNRELDSLIALNRKNQKTIQEQDQLIYTGYFVSGTKRELYKLGITRHEGGLAGVGSVSRVDDHFNKTAFTPLDIRELRRIELNCQSARILTTHPATSYKFYAPDNYIKELIITRPNSFWSTSKYLVIETSG